MVKYNEDFCKAVLKRNGWEPAYAPGNSLRKEWALMAIQIAMLEKLDKK